jgi:hypothetical protein
VSEICGARRLGRFTGRVFVCQLETGHSGAVHHDDRQAHPGECRWSIGTEKQDEEEIRKELGSEIEPKTN